MIPSKSLLEDLKNRTYKNIDTAKILAQCPENELNAKAAPAVWSALECIEHLNLYGDFYLPEIAQRIADAKTGPEVDFRSGLLGNYFAKSMLPKEKLNKMKTFKDKNPNGSRLSEKTIEKFLGQQKLTLELLDRAKGVSLNKTKTAISISKMLKLRLGDTLRVVVYHNQRHVLQAVKAAGIQ